MGKRENEPAKGEWFVPGGTVRKNEPRTEAVHRVATEELGEAVVVDDCLGTYEHFYETADVDGVDSKHYLVNRYVVDVSSGEVDPDDQHDKFRVFRSAPEPCHEYVQAYVEIAATVNDWF